MPMYYLIQIEINLDNLVQTCIPVLVFEAGSHLGHEFANAVKRQVLSKAILGFITLH
jgi:hypothetical protein